MAKSKTIHPMSGKLGDHVYVDGKDGYRVRNAPKKKRRKKQPAFDAQSSRTTYLNNLGGELNTIIEGYCGNFKQSNFYRLLQRRFRKEPLNNRFLLLKQLERMEVNERYPLHKLGGARLSVKDNGNKMMVTVEVDYHPPASVARHKVNCYEYQILLLYWVKGGVAAVPDPQYGEWRYLKDKLPVFDFKFNLPADTMEWLVCLRQRVGYNEEAIGTFSAEGMQIALAGTFDKADLELWEKRKAEKMAVEKQAEVKKQQDVVRVKSRR